MIQEFVATNTPQRIDVSERVGRALCAIIRCMLADSGFPSSILGGLFMAAAYLKNMNAHTALKRETSFEMLHGKEADLSHLRVLEIRTYVHRKDSRNLDFAAWEGKMCSYSEERKSYRV